MTAATAGLWPARPARRQGPVLRTAVSLLIYIGRISLWYWALVAVVAIGLPFVFAAFSDVQLSVLSFARQSGVWFPFSMLVSVAAVYPPVHVASGMTRRSYTRGSLIAAVVLAGAFAGIMSLGLLAERAWYGAMGWEWAWQYQQGWFTPDGGLGTVLMAYAATFLVAYVSGLLVGTVYAVAGGWWGTLTLPFTVGPILVVFALVDGSAVLEPFIGRFGVGELAGPVSVSLLAIVSVALSAVLATAFALLSNRRAIAPRKG